MKHNPIPNLALSGFLLAAGLFLAAGKASAREPGEQPIGWSKMRVADSPIKPIYASELDKEAEEAKARTDKMAEELKQVKVDPEADSVEKAWPGAISLERHRADIAALRDQFTLCTAALEQKIREKEASGAATATEREQLKACMDRCKAALDTMDKMHYNSSAMLSATRKVYFLDGWEKHQKLMAQLQEQMKDCPMMVKEALACCGDPAPAQPSPPPVK